MVAVDAEQVQTRVVDRDLRVRQKLDGARAELDDAAGSDDLVELDYFVEMQRDVPRLHS